MFETTKTPVKTAEIMRPVFRTPVALFDTLFNEMESFWPKVLRPPRRFEKEMAPWMPTVDVYEREGELTVKADLPGLTKDDVKIFFEEGALVLQGERKEEQKVEKESYYLAESTYGSFYRRLPLTFNVDPAKIVARFTDGVLEIRIPMPKEEPPKAQAIPVN